MRLLFFDYSGQLLHQKVIKPFRGAFQYPTEAAFYALEMVATGMKQMRFHRIDIVPLATPETELKSIDFNDQFQVNQRLLTQRQAIINHYLK